MKLFLMTDLEGVCGVSNFEEWAVPQGRYYEEAKRLLTLEVNAAAAGFFEAGATEILVVDGHGPGGVNQLLLDQRLRYLRGPTPGPYPFLLDESFDAMAWVGQHAKAGTPLAHMPHTGSFNVIDYRINGRSVGEFGQMALCGAHFGVKAIFACGDEALEKEAAELVAGIETVSVKRGVMPGSGDAEDEQAYRRRNNGAVHLHPELAREKIRAGARAALRRFAQNREQFCLPGPKGPLTREIVFRYKEGRQGYTMVTRADDILHLLNDQAYFVSF